MVTVCLLAVLARDCCGSPLSNTLVRTGEHRDLGALVDADLTVSAHPILHTIPCHGYVISEPERRGRVGAR